MGSTPLGKKYLSMGPPVHFLASPLPAPHHGEPVLTPLPHAARSPSPQVTPRRRGRWDQFCTRASLGTGAIETALRLTPVVHALPGCIAVMSIWFYVNGKDTSCSSYECMSGQLFAQVQCSSFSPTAVI